VRSSTECCHQQGQSLHIANAQFFQVIESVGEILSTLFSFLVRRAVGVSKTKEVSRPDAFGVITTRKAGHPKGEAQRRNALARLTA